MPAPGCHPESGPEMWIQSRATPIPPPQQSYQAALMPAGYQSAPMPAPHPSYQAAPMTAPQQSYREMLRAGGRGAFQRSIDAGFMPTNMKQGWDTVQMPQNQAQGRVAQQGQMEHQNAAMPYAMAYDGQQMWNGAEGQMHSDDCWSVPFDQSQMSSQSMYTQDSQIQDPMMMHQQMPFHIMPEMDMAMQQPQMQLECDQLQRMVQNEGPQLPQISMAAPPTNTAVDETDTEMMALQLRAAAELNQCYED